jgi:DNA-binding NarL/FixJ family response regulator
LAAGARGYIPKSDLRRDLVTAVEAVRRNKMFFPAQAAQIFMDGTSEKKTRNEEAAAETSRLTPRQREVVQLLAEGKSSKEVAVALNLSVKTAETHRANIMRRLDFHSICEIVRFAVRNNIIEA